jgi:hypothetical protein
VRPCGAVLFPSASRSERLAKYNQLLRIEEELGEDAGESTHTVAVTMSRCACANRLPSTPTLAELC